MIHASLLLMSGLLLPQDVGGGVTTHFKIFGTENLGSFGHLVNGVGDITGDGVDEFMVGAPGEAGSRGSAYLYSGFDGSLLFKWTGESAGDSFGCSMCSPGDLDLDGYLDILIGANRVSIGLASGAGRLYAYSGRTGAELFRLDQATTYAGFGGTCSPVGDLDHDSIPDFLVGAPGWGPGTGKVFVYSGTGSLLRQHQGVSGGGQFGSSLDGGADFDLDGVPDYLVGAPGANPGRFFLYSGASGTVLWEKVGQARLGYSLCIAGDFDLDGIPDIASGDTGTAQGGLVFVGSVMVYSYPTGAELFRFDGVFDREQYGTSVANAGDFNFDGMSDLVVGAPGHGVIVGPGRIEVRAGNDGQVLFASSGSSAGDSFGDSVSAAFNLKGTGRTSVLVGGFEEVDPRLGTQVGSMKAIGDSPFLFPTRDTYSVSQGGIVGYRLDFPNGAGGEVYQILASATGTGPMWLGSLVVPLNRDSLTESMLRGEYPSVLYQPVGLLDSRGEGLSFLLAGPGSLPNGLVGRTLWVAAVSIPLTGTWHYSSRVAQLTFLP